MQVQIRILNCNSDFAFHVNTALNESNEEIISSRETELRIFERHALSKMFQCYSRRVFTLNSEILIVRDSTFTYCYVEH